jgi:hypothetical protein
VKTHRTLGDLAKEQQRIAGNRSTEKPDDEIASKQIESAASMLEFLERARNGEMMPPEVIIQYSTYFRDDLTLDNMPRMQLINVRSTLIAKTSILSSCSRSNYRFFNSRFVASLI